MKTSNFSVHTLLVAVLPGFVGKVIQWLTPSQPWLKVIVLVAIKLPALLNIFEKQSCMTVLSSMIDFSVSYGSECCSLLVVSPGSRQFVSF